MRDKLETVDKLIMILVLIALMLSAVAHGQHPNDNCPNTLCWDAESIEIIPCYTGRVSTVDCGFDQYIDFEDNMMDDGVGFGLASPCHGWNYEVWYEFNKLSNTSPLFIDLYGGYCLHPDFPNVPTGSYGLLQGWVITLWYGEDCGISQIVWSTHCKHLTDTNPGIIDSWIANASDESDIIDMQVDYDPNLQEYSIVILDAPAGQYFLQIDGWGWCQGETWLKVCENGNVLGIEFPQTDTIYIDGQTLEPVKRKRYDAVGRRVE